MYREGILESADRCDNSGDRDEARKRPGRGLVMRLIIGIMILILFFTVAAVPGAWADTIIDNGMTGTSFTGPWGISGASGSYGTDSVWSRDGATYTWSFAPTVSGSYQVSMWWTEWSSRSSAIPVDIQYAGGTARVMINQLQNGGRWNLLGTYTFNAGVPYRITIISQPGPSSTCADAVKFAPAGGNIAPVAVIDSITPDPALVGQTVTFSGHGTDSDGTIAAYEWSSSLDGLLGSAASFTTSSLRAGTHTISFRVQDNQGSWSAAVPHMLTVNAPAGEVVVDNLSGATIKTGVWEKSSAAGYYGTDSVWSRDGTTFTWSFAPTVSGSYQVSMWWTEWSSRSSAIPVDIQYAGGAARVMINQLQNGGRWNLLGTYTFNAGVTYRITIISQPGPSSTCADAVKFAYSPNANQPPEASIDSITPNPAAAGASVTLSGHGTDSDGTITGYSWRSNIDGALGNAATFSTNTLTTDIHTIYFRVRDDRGDWSPEVSTTLIVSAQVRETEHIYLVVMYNTKRSDFVGMLQSVGAVQAGDIWTYTNVAQKKDYIIHLVEDMAGARQALYTENAHVIMGGHSNYGMGGVFATPEETLSNVIETIRYIDDPRIFTYSSPWFFVSVSGLIEDQAYPNWRPVFQDGTSGIMPYAFGDPRGDPAYNYYPTYQVPGDPTRYKIETVRNSAHERFPESGVPAWYSSSGARPDPANPDDLKYYIVNTDTSFASDVKWLSARDVAGYYGSNYCSVAAGQEAGQVRWNFDLPSGGVYRVYAWWPASAAMVPDATYSVGDTNGTHEVTVDQRVNGGRWNVLGDFTYGAGTYSVTLGSGAGTGIVAADAIRINRPDNPSLYDRIVDNQRCPKSHYGNETILFRKDPDLDINSLRYKRLLFDACNVGIYYLDTFHRGLMFYTSVGSDGSGTYPYLKNYLEGKSDEEIWSAMQAVQSVYDYYDFTKRPSEQ